MKLSHLFLPSLLALANALPTYAESGRDDYDLDDNGLIEINDLADLNEIRNNLDGTALYDDLDASNNGCPQPDGCHGFELTTDLDFDTNGDGVIDENDDYWNNGEGWEPIGNYQISNAGAETPFTAVFNGNDHRILNLYIHCSASDDYQHGLFGFIRNASISNLELSGELTSVDCPLAEGAVGGLVGEMDSSDVTHTHINATVIGGDGTGVGGLIGKAEDSSVSYSSSDSRVTGLGKLRSGVGGLIGFIENSSASNLESSGHVQRTYTDDVFTIIGGLMGTAYDTDVILSHSSASVDATEGEGYTHAGGLLGSLDGGNWRRVML